MPKEIFRVTSAGSVDDGKSTILARILIDTGSIFEDQLGKDYDQNKIADLLDGLESEREQGITIDVAHRFFDTEKRRYQIADSPGHEQYTRNMATACAGSNALILVVDAVDGIKSQTLHHLEVALRLGLRDIIFAINKIDLVGFSKKRFAEISKEIELHVSSRNSHFPGIKHTLVPISGLLGYNVVRKSSRLNWFTGPTLIDALDEIRKPKKTSGDPAFQIQYVQRLSGGGRNYLGQVVSGFVAESQQLYCEGAEISVTSLWVNGQKAARAEAGAAISIQINRELDLSRGQLFTAMPPNLQEQFEIDLIWFANQKGMKSTKYILKLGTATRAARLTKLFRIELETNQKAGEIQSIATNQIVRANISLSEPLEMKQFAKFPELGRFILIDPASGQTVAAGTANFALRRSENIYRHETSVSSEMLSELTNNTPRVIWMTGLSGSGKSTLANAVGSALYTLGKPHYILDGDNLRLGINRDLGFTEEDRTENIRRTAELASLMANAGLVVLVALVSPLERDRQMAREIIGEERFRLVHVATPIEVCEQRDPKGLYKRARKGEIPNFTGVSSKFEIPETPDFLASENTTAEEIVKSLM